MVDAASLEVVRLRGCGIGGLDPGGAVRGCGLGAAASTATAPSTAPFAAAFVAVALAAFRAGDRLPERRRALWRAAADVAQSAGLTSLLAEILTKEDGAAFRGTGVLGDPIE